MSVQRYKPGSFSKNFAWSSGGSVGLSKLHQSIKSGFSNKLNPVTRNYWRENSKINNSALELIPINFFLFNSDGIIEVDELVFCAIQKPHSLDFDRLALFSFNFSRVGSPPKGGPGEPAKWANEFVRERLWRDGYWQQSALIKSEMEKFIEPRIDGDSAHKNVTNYRFLWELSGYVQPNSLNRIINSGANTWAKSALYLCWDRYILSGNAPNKADLLSILDDWEIYKLIGTNEGWVQSLAVSSLPEYLERNNISRFRSSNKPNNKTQPTNKGEEQEAEHALTDQDDSDKAVERHVSSFLKLKRDRRLPARLKVHYKNRCQFCRTQIKISDQKFYSEAAHIKPVGMPHNGPDKLKNMLILCPNHHIQFDYGVIRLEYLSEKEIVMITEDKLFDGKKILIKHKIEPGFVKWHFDWHERTRIYSGQAFS